MYTYPECFFLLDSFFPAVINYQGIVVLVFLLMGFLLISFFVSGAEVAYFSLSYKDINMLKTRQNDGYKRIVKLLEDPQILLASLLIANSFVNMAIIILSNFLIDSIFQFNYSLWWAELTIKVLVVSFVLVLFGEVMPKVMATQNNLRFAKDSGRLVEIVLFLLHGLSKKLVSTSGFVERKLANKVGNGYSLEELDHAIDIATDHDGSVDEKNILKGIVKFSNISARQVMKSRLDVHGISYSTPFGQLIRTVEELHYSRLPVYKDNLDEIVGMVHTKDLLPYIDEKDDFNWHHLLRTPFFIHEQKLIKDLLQEFQNKRIHFAVVVDEFGGTSGIVTLEDIMEEIIGDIKDEFDDEEASFSKVDDNTFVFDGKVMIKDVCKAMELPLNIFDSVKGNSESLGGLVLELAGEIPAVNQITQWDNFKFDVLEVEKNRLQKIKVSIQPQSGL